MKVFFDKVLSLTLILLFIPIFIFLILVNFIFNGSPIFFIQERSGMNKKKINLIKLRTIKLDCKDINKINYTRFGKFFRRSGLDEIFQLFNILKGDISVVGPRPLVTKTFSSYTQEIQSKIYNVKPGLTGIGSIVFRDEESLISKVKDEDPHEFYKRVIAPYKGELEMWYQDHKSVFIDLQLIFLTAWVIFFPNSKLYEQLFKDLPKRSF